MKNFWKKEENNIEIQNIEILNNGKVEKSKLFLLEIEDEINLKIEDKFVFDVTDANGKDSKKFHEIRKNLIEQMKNTGNSATVSNKNFDNAVFNYISKKLKKQVVVANSFTYDEYEIQTRIPNGVEICIMEKRIIVLKDLKEVKK